MKFDLEPYHRNVPDEELILDIQRVASESMATTVTKEHYRFAGRFGSETIRRRFGSWNAALRLAGLVPAKRWRIPDEELFANLEEIWRHLGRQPRRSDLDIVPTKISKSVYEQRFGSWRKALEMFIAWVNSEENESLADIEPTPSHRRTSRQPSLRLRFRVMRRDRFSCCHCGRSPSSTPSLELHVDHIIPWSKGGETQLSNLQTLCEECNLGKSDLTEDGA